ncbi:MAG: hypothetical protein ACXVCP_02190 [Bdellovibrio sp.]
MKNVLVSLSLFLMCIDCFSSQGGSADPDPKGNCENLIKRIANVQSSSNKFHNTVVTQTQNISTILEIMYGDFRQLYGKGPVQEGYFDGLVSVGNMTRNNANSYSTQANELNDQLTDIIIDLSSCYSIKSKQEK